MIEPKLLPDNPANWHHAYLVVGEIKRWLPKLVKEINDITGRESRRDPDFICQTYDQFGITEARQIRTWQTYQAAAGGRKLIILACERLTREAQNALLKTFEEPTPGTHFFMVLPSADWLLPTLRSRLFSLRDRSVAAVTERAKNFLAAAASDRLKLVAELLAAEEKAKAETRTFLGELAASLNHGREFPPELVLAGRELIRSQSYLSDPAAAPRLILEHLALVLPRFKN